MNPNETLRQYHDRRFEDLKSLRNPWEARWRDLADFNAPERLRLNLTEQEGQKKRQKILNSSTTFALRTLASGMHSGITSPARPWFKLGPMDDDLKEFPPVKEYLSKVESEMRKVFAASNFYTTFHTGYFDQGLFGQSCALLIEDDRKTARMQQLLTGTFWLERDETGRATTLYRQFLWSVEKIVGRFGYDACSRPIKNAYDKGNYSDRFLINHAIEPRKKRQLGKIDKRNKPFLSNYWEAEGRKNDGDGMLEVSGFNSNPIISAPWELFGDDSYAYAPGMDVLPDAKVLQKLELWAGEAVEKGVRPPMVGPLSLQNNPASLMPNSVTYVDSVTGGTSFQPAMQVNLDLGKLEEIKRQTIERINRGYYADLFLMLANMEGIQPRNQFEIAERKEEKLLALGPVLENIYGNQLAPTIDRTFEIMSERRMLPPPPDDLRGQELKIEYISILAQAQKAVSTGSIERVASFVGSFAGVNPTVLDKLNMDQAIDEYADMIGAPPSIIVSDDEVKRVRDQRAQKQQQAEQMAAMAQMAPAAKQGADAARLLSETDAGGTGNLLQQIGIA